MGIAEVKNMNGNKPSHKVQCGAVSVAVWSNEIDEDRAKAMAKAVGEAR